MAMDWYDNGRGMMNNSVFGIFGMVLMVILFIVLVWVVFRIVDHGSHTHARHEMNHELKNLPTALDVLDMRLAKGEISPEEYATLKEHLKK